MSGKHTERSVLDALHRRYCVPGGYGRPQRHVVAEKVPDHPWNPSRVLDAVLVDTWPGTGISHRDGGRGYGMHGVEVKVSRADLRRELEDPTKAGTFTDEGGILTHFWLLAPEAVLDHWRKLGIPEHWGVMSLREDGSIRALRTAPRLRERLTLEVSAAAVLSRRVHATTSTVCAAHGGTFDPRGIGKKADEGS